MADCLEWFKRGLFFSIGWFVANGVLAFIVSILSKGIH